MKLTLAVVAAMMTASAASAQNQDYRRDDGNYQRGDGYGDNRDSGNRDNGYRDNGNRNAGYRNGDRRDGYRDRHTYNGNRGEDCRRSNGTTGTIAGAVGGGVLGNVLGGGTLGTLAGAGGGALVGRTLDKNHDRSQNRRNGC